VDINQIPAELKRYETELAAILSRFTRTRGSIHIGEGDDPLFRQYVGELIDLFNDALGQNNYSRQIAGEFNDGISNFVESPSFKSVENILSIVRAASTRFFRNPELLVQKKAEETPSRTSGMTDAQLEIAILRRYVEHHDAVGTDAHKCARELDMRQVISSIIGRPVDEGVVKRWHAQLAPRSPPYKAGVLRPCGDSTINNGQHAFHARAYYEPGRAPAWERIRHLESQLPVQPSMEKEKEQKFGILNSLRQTTIDFASYSSERGAGANIGVLFLDIDNFKSLNGRFTESVVDRDILIPFQKLLRASCVHRGDAYRHGGEEFLVLLPNHTPEEVAQFAQRLRAQIEAQEFSVGGSSVQITASIGIALWPDHAETLEDLIAKANIAEHTAKEKGKNRVEIYDKSAA
jgi:diguanylate cyclase (GGDEF)-like protein